MDFRELSYVLAIAKYQNITKAADSLYVGQPTLSKFLIRLESDLGIKLFRRSGNKYYLTYAGERYVRQAAEIMRLKSDLDTELADIRQQDAGTLSVAFTNMRCTHMLPSILPAFEKLHPHVQICLHEGSSVENDKGILEGEVEVAFYTKPSQTNPQLSYESLGREELLIVTSPGHPAVRFAKKSGDSPYPLLDPKCLTAERILLMRPEQRTRQLVDAYLKAHEISFENVLYTGNIPAIIELVAQGYGISFLFDTHLNHHLGQNPVDRYRFASGAIEADFVAASRKGSYLSVYARDFISLARQVHQGAPEP